MTSIGNGVKKKTKQARNKERANMSFFIVVMFFAVFGIIVFTEIFLIDERGHGAGVVVRHGSLGGGFRHRSSNDRPDYEDVVQVRQFIYSITQPGLKFLGLRIIKIDCSVSNLD